MILFVGLGNPGIEYRFTRHNFGFMVLDALQEDYGLSPWKDKFKGLISEGTIGNHKVILLKPQTFMNLSGQSVAAAMQFYKIPLDHVIVLHDDLDLSLQTVRTKKGGSAGGHKGIQDIDRCLGPEYTRIRLGIDHPRNIASAQSVSHYVLNPFSKQEMVGVGAVIDSIATHFKKFLEEGAERFVSIVTEDLKNLKETENGL